MTITSIQEAWITLGLQPGTDLNIIKQAYRTLAKQWHPDKFVGDPQEQQKAREQFQRIHQAYELIKNYLSNPQDSEVIAISKKATPDFYYHRGVINAKLEDYEAAIDDFTQAIRLEKDYLKAYQYRAFLYEKLGYNNRAESDFNTIQKLKLKKVAQDSSLDPSSKTSHDSQASKQSSSTHPSPDTFFHTQLSRWNCIHTLIDHQSPVISLDISREGLLVSGSADGTVKLWSLKTGILLKTLERQGDYLNQVALSSRSQYLAVATPDYRIKLWEIINNKLELITTFRGHRDSITCVAFSPNRQIIISGSKDKTVKLWNTQTSKLVTTLTGYSAHLTALALYPNSTWFASSALEPIVRIRQISSGKLVRSLRTPSATLALAFSADGLTLATAGYDCQIYLWQLATYTLIGSWSHGDRVSAIAFSPNQTFIASSSNGAIELWDTTGKHLDTIRGHDGEITSLKFFPRPQPQILVSGSRDGTVKIWKPSC